ncbi:MAG: flagellar basal-body MS-ring/collar protein FliF [Thermacetogeniaceae bacterium]
MVRDALLRYKEVLLERWKKLDKKQRFLFVGGVALIFLLAVYLSVIASRPKFVPLYTNLDQQDAAAIVEQLKDKKVAYRLSDDGSTILVPESQKYELRLELATQGLPKGGSVGFESLNQTRFGETESERKTRYLIALQGELERTIRRLDGVEDVRVHIVVPEPSLFVEEEKEATAAVLLKLRPGYQLQPQQVEGIMRLVAAGVEGLKPENVTVVDTEGNVLSEGVSGQGASQTSKLTATQMQLQQEYERQLEKSVQSMLERVVGQGKVVVRVNAVLDFDQVEISSETYGDKQIRSQQQTEEISTGAANPQGAAGTPTNIPQYAQQGVQAGGQYQKTEKTTNYEVDKSTEHRIVAPGKIKQLSVAVLVDGQMDPLKQREIEDLVTAAAGIDPNRRDNLTVASMPFNTSLSQQMAKEMEAARHREQVLKVGMAIGALLVLALTAWLIVRRRRRAEETGYLAGPAISLEEVLATREEELSPEEKEKARIMEYIQNLIKQNPREVAQLLRTWLNEDSR